MLRAFILFAPIIVFTVLGGGAHVNAQAPPPPPIIITVVETVSVSDGPTSTPPEVIAVDESISVVETASVIGPAVILVNEQIQVSDTGGPVNAAPIVDAGPVLTADEGEAVDLVASVIVLDPQLTTATIDWGDGSTDQVVPTTAGTISATHLYTDDGTYTVAVTVNGLFGDQGTDNAQVEVLNLPPVVDAGGPYTLDTAGPIGAVVLTAIASDPGDDPITYAWDLDGDGQFDDGSGQSEMFTSPTTGVFSVSVEVQDDSGATTVGSSDVTVTDSVAGPGLPDDGTTEPADPSDTWLRLVATNGSVARPFQDGDQIRLVAQLQPGADYVDGSVDRIEFSLNGLPFPPDALVIAVPGPTVSYRVMMGAGTASAGDLLTFVATAVDSAGDVVAAASLQIAIAPPLLVNIIGPDEIAPGQSAVFQAEVFGGEQPVDVTFRINNLVVSRGASFLSVTPEMIPGGPGESFVITVQAVDDLGSSGTALHSVEVTAPAGDETPKGPDDGLRRADDIGRAFGRAVIGRLVSLSDTLIVVTTRVGPDFTDVRVNVDRGATEFSEALDAEAYTTGSKIVVIADGDVLSGNATAIRITPIPSRSTRLHERVLVTSPTDGNAAEFVSDDGTVGGSVIKDEVGQFRAGDQVVVLKRRDDSNRRGDKPRILVKANDIEDRLERFAKKKFDDGDTSASGLIDRLSDDRRDDARVRVDRAKKHRDRAVRDAAERAEASIKDARERDASDPTTVIRKKAVRDLEQKILECVSRTVGRTISGEGDLTERERERVAAVCLDDGPGGDGGVRIPENPGSEQRDAPPPEILECIVRVLGSVPDRPITSAEEARLRAACDSSRTAPPPDVLACIVKVLGRVPDASTTAEERARFEAACSSAGDGPGSGEARDRDPKSELDARKVAFCNSNPSDPNCTGRAGGSSGPGGDNPGSEAEKRAYCNANPSDSRCSGGGSSNDGNGSGQSSEAEKRAYCNANPSDSRCSGGGGSNDGSGSGDGSKDGPATKPPGK